MPWSCRMCASAWCAARASPTIPGMTDDARLFLRSELLERGIERPDREPQPGVRRLRRGVYGSVSPDAAAGARYRLRVLAAHRTLTGDHVFSHEAAAVLLGLPALHGWPDRVHLICERRSGGRSQLDVVRHCLGLEAVQPVDVEGVLVTSPARTAFDIALVRPFADAVVVADAALRHPGAGAELASLVAWYERGRGHARLGRVAAFADPLGETPGESWSRVRMAELGFAAPLLQFAVVSRGRTEFADFAWLGGRVLGEFDGEVKYRLDRYRKGGTAEDVVIREKNRENRMRVGRSGFARWDWSDLRSDRLAAILREAGVPRTA
jgi:hypothetical protein